MHGVNDTALEHGMRLTLCLTLMIAHATSGCIVTTDEDLWKDSGADAAAEASAQLDLALDGDDAGPDARRDAAEPELDGRLADGSAPDGVGDARQLDAAPDALLPDAAPDAPLVPDIGPRPVGDPCVAAGQCLSGHCVGDVCCATACTAPCSSCGLVGSLGTCTAAPVGMDPHGDCMQDPVSTCGLDGTCDGAGGCRTYPQGTACIPDQCVADTRITGSTCDASGACVAKPELECAPYRCDPATKSCFATCTDDAQCSRYRCNVGASACFASCTTPAECQKGYKCTAGSCQ